MTDIKEKSIQRHIYSDPGPVALSQLEDIDTNENFINSGKDF